MGKQYQSAGPGIDQRIEALRSKYYDSLDGVTVGALFVFDQDENIQVLTHHGYPAAALIRIVGARDRAAGLPDAQMVIDKCVWESCESKRQIAILDHELYHLERVVDKHGTHLFDSVDRPRLRIRKHDWSFGWFDEIAKRHAEHSIEVLEAERLLRGSGQLYFQFGPEQKVA